MCFWRRDYYYKDSVDSSQDYAIHSHHQFYPPNILSIELFGPHVKLIKKISSEKLPKFGLGAEKFVRRKINETW